MKTLKTFTFGPMTCAGATAAEAKDKTLKAAQDYMHRCNVALDLLPLRGIGQVEFVFVLATLEGAEYGWMDTDGTRSRIITSGMCSLEDAVVSAIRHVADNYMGHWATDAATIARGEGWVREAARSWGLSAARTAQVIAEIASLRRGRAKITASLHGQ